MPYGVYSEWKHLLPDIFYQELDETQILEGIDSSFKNKWTSENLKNALDNLSADNRTTFFELVHLFLGLVKQTDNLIAWKKLNSSFEELFIQLETPLPKINQINRVVDAWLEKKEKHAFRLEINIPVSLSLVFLDVILRWLGVVLSNAEDIIGLFGMYLNRESFLQFWNWMVVPTIILFSVLILPRLKKRKTQNLLRSLELENAKLIPAVNAWHYFIMAILAISGAGAAELLIDDFFDQSAIALAMLVAVLFIYYYILLQYFSLPVPSSKEIYQKLKEKDQIEIEEKLGSDENDIEIVAQEVRLRSLNEKMNAYVLEAALFGALAFSGFIQIIASEIFNLQAFQDFNLTFIELARSVILGDLSNTELYFDQLLHRNTMLSLLCYESLFCSICFLSVISSRMRYGDLTDLLDKSLALSKNFNKKEEGLLLYQNRSKEDDSVKKYGELINQHLQKGIRDYHQIKPVLEFMRFFRTIGISTFFIILITAGLFISPFVSILFFAIFALSFVYFKFGHIKEFYTQLRTQIQEGRARSEKQVYIGFALFVLAVMTYRTFYLPGSHALGFMVILILGLHQITLVIEGKRLGFTSQLFSKIFRFGIIVLFLGLGLKWMMWPGASVFILIGTLMLTFFFSFHPFKLETPWTTRLLSISFGLGVLGVIFKMQHFPGASILLILSSFGFILFFLTTSIQKRDEKINLLLGLCLSLGILATIFKIQHWEGAGILYWFGTAGTLLSLAFILKTRKLFDLPSLYKNLVISVVVIIAFAGATRGIGTSFLSQMNFDFQAANSFMKINPIKNKIWHELPSPFDRDYSINYGNNDTLKPIIDNFLFKEIDWTKDQPILGWYVIEALDQSYSLTFDKITIAIDTFSLEQNKKMQSIGKKAIEAIESSNTNYLKCHRIDKSFVVPRIHLFLSLSYFQTNEYDRAKKELELAKPVQEREKFWGDAIKSMEGLLAKI